MYEVLGFELTYDQIKLVIKKLRKKYNDIDNIDKFYYCLYFEDVKKEVLKILEPMLEANFDDFAEYYLSKEKIHLFHHFESSVWLNPEKYKRYIAEILECNEDEIETIKKDKRFTSTEVIVNGKLIILENKKIAEYLTDLKINQIRNELLEKYEDLGTDKEFTELQKKEGLNSTIETIEKEVKPKIKTERLKSELNNRIEKLKKKIDTPKMLRTLIEYIEITKTNYVMKHKKMNKIFYPVIADILLSDILILDHLETYKEFINPNASNYYSVINSPPSKKYFNLLPDEPKKSIVFKVHINNKMNIRHFTTSYFSSHLNVNYDNMRKLSNYIYYWNSKDSNIPKIPYKEAIEPPINPFRFSTSLIA